MTVKILKFAIFWYFFQYFFTRVLNVLPDAFVWVDDILFWLLFVYAMFVRFGKKNRRKGGKNTFVVWVFLFIISGLTSAYANGTLFTLNTVLGLRNFLQPIIIYFIILFLPFSHKNLLSIFKFVCLMVFIQLPIVLWQAATYTPNLTYGFFDAMYGTFGFGSANIFGIFLSFFILGTYVFYRYEYITKRQAFTYWAILGIPFFLAFSKMGILVLLFGIGITFYMIGRMEDKPFLTYALKVFGGVLLVFVFLNGLILADFNKDLTKDLTLLVTQKGYAAILENETSAKGSGRLFIAAETEAGMSSNATTALLGWGPGEYSSFAGFTLKPPRIRRWLAYFKTQGSRFDMEVVALAGEFGLVGLFLYVGIYGSLFNKFRHMRFGPSFEFWSALQLILQTVIILMFFAFIADNVFQTQWVSDTFWLMSGLLAKANAQINLR